MVDGSPYSGRPSGTPVSASPGDGRVEVLTFRTRAVLVSGVVDLGLAACAFGGAPVVALVVTGSDRLPFSLLLGLVGLLLLVSGIGRVRSRLEIHRDSLEWTWALVRQRVPPAELVDADIAEKGRPTPGGSWAGLIGGGFTWVFLW